MTDDAANSTTAPTDGTADGTDVAPGADAAAEPAVAAEANGASVASDVSEAVDGQMSAEQRRSLAAATLRHARRIVVLVVGLTVVAAGIAMLVLPGPGLVAIVAGLAILATEFAWAQRYLEKTKEKAAQGVDVGKKAVGRLRKKSSTDG